MFGIGMPELLLILVVALVVVGPRKLPDIAKNLGKGLSEFRRATDEFKSQLNENEVVKDVQNMREDFKQTVDAMNPRTVFDASAKLEPSEPKPDLAARQAVYQAIDDEQAAVAPTTPPPAPAAGQAQPKADA
ncbi:Sec-independent protein translocase protein TatB [Desulfarculus baarsii]